MAGEIPIVDISVVFFERGMFKDLLKMYLLDDASAEKRREVFQSMSNMISYPSIKPNETAYDYVHDSAVRARMLQTLNELRKEYSA